MKHNYKHLRRLEERLELTKKQPMNTDKEARKYDHQDYKRLFYLDCYKRGRDEPDFVFHTYSSRITIVQLIEYFDYWVENDPQACYFINGICIVMGDLSPNMIQEVTLEETINTIP